MLSSGANLFPMSKIWKELIHLEIEENLVYHWYTSPEGFPTLQRAVKFFEWFAASEGNLNMAFNYGVCMTLGASQAAAIVFDFIAHKFSKSKVLLLGYNYPLFERLARHYGMAIKELISYEGCTTLPSPDKVEEELSKQRPQLLVITVPNNPSGEIYTASELVRILQSASCFGSLVIIDKVGEWSVSQDPWINIGKLIITMQLQSQVILINSFSKTDSVPGFRIGYLLASSEIIEHAAKYQLSSIMNPPTFPVLPVFFSLLSRCFFIKQRFQWNHYDNLFLLNLFYRVFEVTTAIMPLSMNEKIKELFSSKKFLYAYNQYVHDCLAKFSVIRSNYEYIQNRLGNYIGEQTKLQAGFNFLVKFEPFSGTEEDEICAKLFSQTGLAILTESAFCLNRPKGNFWIRISMAAPETDFQEAVEKLVHFLSTCE